MAVVHENKPFELISSTGAASRTDIPENHFCRNVALGMAQIHNTFFRALNSCHAQAPLIEPGSQDAADFLEYSRYLDHMIHHHHHLEDDVVFPRLQELSGSEEVMKENTAQHEEMADSLNKFGEYLKTTTKDTFDAQKYCEAIDSFVGPFHQHMCAEIGTLLDLYKFVDSKALQVVWKETEKEVNNADQYMMGPFIFGLQDKLFLLDGKARAFMDAPFFVPTLIRYMYGYRYSHLWRFSPYTFDGTARPLDYFKKQGSSRSLLARWGL